MDFLSNITTTANESICSSDKPTSAFNVFYLAVIVVMIVCNGALLAAIGANWSSLRHNIVYRYLISCLMSVICFCSVTAYEILHTHDYVYDNHIVGGVLQKYNSNDAAHGKIMSDWSYRRGLMACLFLVMELNIAVLIYAVSDNTQFVGRFSAINATERSRKPGNAAQQAKIKMLWQRLVTGRKGKALLLTTSAWLVPLAISIPTAFQWNCLENCMCLPATRHGFTCFSGNGKICSRLWIPSTQSFVIVITLLYAIAIAFMFAMLTTVVRKFYKTHTPRELQVMMESRRQRAGIDAGTGSPQRNDAWKCRRHDGNEKQMEPPVHRSDTALDIREESHRPKIITFSNKSADDKEEPISCYSPSSERATRPPIHDTIKLLVALTFSLLLSVSPLMIVYVYDVLDTSEPQPISDDTFDGTLVITFLHAAAQPVILLVYMSRLRKSCINVLLKLPCMRKIEAVIRNPRSTLRSGRAKLRKEARPQGTTLQKASNEVVESSSQIVSVGIENFANDIFAEIFPDNVSQNRNEQNCEP